MKDKKVLLIDDDSAFLYIARLIVEKAGARVLTAADGLEGLSKFFAHRPDLIILDVTMPGMNGFEVCRRIRQVAETPIIMLTALHDQQEMLRGLDAGADDFLSKPFSPEILLARAKAVLRRAEQTLPRTDIFGYVNGHLRIDFEKREVLVDEQRVKLTPTEFRLLTYLVRNAGRALTFEQILVNVWGEQYQGNLDYVHVYISQLRNKIEPNPKQPRYIMNVHSVGYLFQT